MDEQMIEPCPFCGGIAEDFESQQDGLFYVQCQSCMARTGPIFLSNSHDAAIAAWNHRAAHSVIAGKVAELEGAGRLALKVAESWIHDQLDGTSMLNDALAELDPARAALAPHPKARQHKASYVDYCQGHCAGSRCDGTCFDRERAASRGTDHGKG